MFCPPDGLAYRAGNRKANQSSPMCFFGWPLANWFHWNDKTQPFKEKPAASLSSYMKKPTNGTVFVYPHTFAEAASKKFTFSGRSPR